VQATFLDAIEKAARWDEQRPLLPWLIGILVNHARAMRRQHARALDASRLPPPEAPSPLDELAQQETAERIAAAVRALPRQYRQVLTLRLVHGLSPTAIAHALGCPVATCKTRLQRGMEWLRKALPASLAGSAALLVAAGRGLAQVRAVVLERAASLVPVAGAVGSLSLLLGGLAVKKLALALATAALALVAWIALQPPEAPAAAPRAIAPIDASVAAVPNAVAQAHDTATSTGDAGRTAVVTDPAATTGGLALEFVWADDGSPAAQVHVQYRCGQGPLSMWSTDAAGMLRRSGLRPGDYELFGFSFAHRTAVRPGETTTARITVKPELRIRGVVVDTAGRPVADAAIEAQYFPNTAELEERTVARSGADGTFRCRLDGGSYLWAHRAGFATSTAVCVTSYDNPELRLVLGAGAGSVHGRVRTADGASAGGAQLTIVRTSPRDVCGGPLRLQAAADGTFATDELGNGEHLLVAMAAGHAATPITFAVAANEPTLLDVRLQRGAVITGTIRRNGNARPRVHVELRPDWAGGAQFVEARRPMHHLCAVTAAADAHGTYRLVHVPAGTVTIACSAADVPDMVRHLEVADGDAVQCDFDLADGGALRGRAIDKNGAPLADWQIAASPIGGGRGLMETVDRDGRFVLQGTTAAHYHLALLPAHEALRVPWFEVADVTPGQGELLVQTPFAADSGGTLLVTVLDAEEHVPEAAEAVLGRDVLGGFRTLTVSDLRRRDDGRFASSKLPPGSYASGFVRIPGQGSVAIAAFALPEHGEVDLGTARLPASGSLELAFRTAEGRAVVPAELAVFDNAANSGREFERGDDGALRSKALPAGSYRVRAWGEDIAPFEQSVAIVAGRSSRYELTVTAAARVRFTCPPRVRTADEAPGTVDRIGLYLTGSDGKNVGYRQLEPGDDAASCTVGLLPGDYTWETARHVGGRARGTFRVTGTAPLEVAVALPPRD